MSRKLINVLSTEVLREGQGDKGPWKLRKVTATDKDGNPITEQLKTFADFKLGEIEVEVERQESEKYGVSFLLKPVKSGGGNGGEIADLRARVDRLESEVKRVSSIVDVREPGVAPRWREPEAQPEADF